MFYSVRSSISETWKNCLIDPSDVKELVSIQNLEKKINHFVLRDERNKTIHIISLSRVIDCRFVLKLSNVQIPEFFYQPAFLTNINGLNLGVKPNGESISNVVLPPWAHNDPYRFIEINRAALGIFFTLQRNVFLFVCCCEDNQTFLQLGRVMIVTFSQHAHHNC